MTIRIERSERSGDGAAGRTGCVAVVGDPAVASRTETRSPAGPCEVATSFHPTVQRPATYPASLPFVPHAESHTNEYPDGERRPRVRWVTTVDAERVFDDAARQSVADGWRMDPTYEQPAFESAVRTLFLMRDGRIRRILHYDFEGTSIIELEDVELPSH